MIIPIIVLMFKKYKKLFFIFFGFGVLALACIFVPPVNNFAKHNYVQLQCKFGASQSCHNTIDQMLEGNMAFKAYGRNCLHNKFALSCYSAHKELMKQNKQKPANTFLFKGCLFGDNDICKKSAKIFFGLWTKEKSQKKAFSLSSKYLSHALDSLSYSCALKDKSSCKEYKRQWANLGVRFNKHEYDCINGEQKGCRARAEMTKKKEKVLKIFSNYNAADQYGLKSMTCDSTLHFLNQEKLPRDLASKTATLKKKKLELRLSFPRGYSFHLKQDNVSLPSRLRAWLLSEDQQSLFHMLLSGPEEVYKNIYLAGQKGPWTYTQIIDPDTKSRALTINTKSGKIYENLAKGTNKILRFTSKKNQHYLSEIRTKIKGKKQNSHSWYSLDWKGSDQILPKRIYNKKTKEYLEIHSCDYKKDPSTSQASYSSY